MGSVISTIVVATINEAITSASKGTLQVADLKLVTPTAAVETASKDFDVHWQVHIA
jgi:hypothetical protein